MSLTGMKKHIQLLEEAQLVTTEKVGRARICTLAPYAFEGINTWLGRLDRFAQVVERTKGAAMNDTTVTTPNELEIRVERTFDAPRAHVFSVYTDPKLIPEWWGSDTVVEEMDVRPGGKYRFRTTHGVVEGEYREVDAPERLVQTFQNHVQTLEFEDLGGQTKLTQTMRFATTEERDTAMQYGVEAGAQAAASRESTRCCSGWRSSVSRRIDPDTTKRGELDEDHDMQATGWTVRPSASWADRGRGHQGAGQAPEGRGRARRRRSRTRAEGDAGQVEASDLGDGVVPKGQARFRRPSGRRMNPRGRHWGGR